MYLDSSTTRSPSNWRSGFTLVEVVIALTITAFVFGGIITAYVQTTRFAEWTGHSLAAQALAVQQVEQARSAVWDPAIPDRPNEVTNLVLQGRSYTSLANKCFVLTGYSWTNLDIPISGTNFVRATNFVTVRMLYMNNQTNPPIQLQMVQVDTVWPFYRGGATRYYTNRLATYLAPDNRDVSAL